MLTLSNISHPSPPKPALRVCHFAFRCQANGPNPPKSKGQPLPDSQLPLDAVPGRKQCIAEPLFTLTPSQHPSEAAAGPAKDLFQLFKYPPARAGGVPKVVYPLPEAQGTSSSELCFVSASWVCKFKTNAVPGTCALNPALA